LQMWPSWICYPHKNEKYLKDHTHPLWTVHGTHIKAA
jgi:hypothetical protein